MATAVDFAARLIDPQAIKAAGHSAVLAYVSPSRPGSNFGAKPVTKAYAESCKAAGLDVVSIWQYGKPNGTAPSDWTTGYAGGRRMGAEALAAHFDVGGPGFAPVYFAVDEDITLAQWNDLGVQFFRGVNDAIGQQWTGVYGSAKVCAWAVEDGVVGRWVWQTRAWSGSEVVPEAVLYQRVIDTPSAPGPKIDGSSVDVNDILAADFGQWSINRQESPVVVKPEFVALARIGASSSSRHGTRITNFLLHTQEGNGSAESLAAYLNNSANGVSYHYTVRNGLVVYVVDTDESSWSVLDANPYTINLCFAGSRAAWSRAEWLAIERDIRIAAYLAVSDAKKYGFSAEVIAPPYHRADGISDHKYVTKQLGIGSHTDVGNNFPWDVFAAAVREFDSGTPDAPLPNAIDDVAKANPGLGARITRGENVCPDGVGRWTQFEHGNVYWSSSTGAHPIPASLWNKFAELNWEQGPLGYPTTDVTVLRAGFVQGFQGGALYRRGDKTFWVHGAIRDRWNRTGFEGGPFGWPTSDEVPFDTGSYQEFEHGRIYWTPKPTLALLNTGDTDTPVPDIQA